MPGIAKCRCAVFPEQFPLTQLKTLPAPPPLRYFIALLLVAASYVALGKVALLLALPPGYATAVFPPAGLALALCVSSRMRLLPGVFLGSLLLNVQGTLPDHASLATEISAALCIASASTIQTWVGARYMQKWTHEAMDSGRDILHFLFGMPLVCCISASISVLALTIFGKMSIEQVQLNWLAWWIGDFVGMVLVAPLAWIFLASPRPLWWQRRYLLGGPLCVGILFSLLIHNKISHWEHQQQLRIFHVNTHQIGDILQARLSQHEHFLHLIAVVFDDDDRALPASDFRNIVTPHLTQHSEISFLTWSPYITDSQRELFEQNKHLYSQNKLQIWQLQGNERRAATQASHYLPTSFVAPKGSNVNWPGLDLFSIGEVSHFVNKALRQRHVVASAILIDPISKEKYIEVFITAFPSILPRNRENLPLGMLRMRLQLEPFFKQVLKSTEYADLSFSVEDITDVPTSMTSRVNSVHNVEVQHQLHFGMRKYQITFVPSPSYLANHKGWESWIVLAFCLFITSVLSCMLLVVSGDKARIFSLVRESTAHLHEREARLQAILDHAVDAILTVDHQGKLVSANNAACAQFGFTVQQVPKMYLSQLLQSDKPIDMHQLQQRYEERNGEELVLTAINANGHPFPTGFAISQVILAAEVFFVCILRDLTEQKRSQEKIHHLAHHDPLTGLANRITLNLRLDQLLSISRRNKVGVAVMFIDIDHFKKINDSHGHQTGDLFLREIASRLQDLVRDADTIARFGGDEFIVVLAEQNTPEHVTAVANRIVNALAAPYLLADIVVHSGASVGIAMFPQDGENSKVLLRNADIAMYAAKSQGRGNFQFFSSEMNTATHERLLLENRLWLALEQHEFALYLQPQIDLQTGELIGAEALIRWLHPELGLVAPDRFIPVAEDTPLMQPLGDWVLRRGVEILQSWKGAELDQLRLAINLSARQCQVNTLLPMIDKLLLESSIAASMLEMEITETAAMTDPEQTRELLRGLRQRGVQVAIDDFGTGYSSLSYLKLFAIDRIKIDRSFVKDIETDPNDAVIVGATIALAHSLGLEVIAEGVETEAQCRYLLERQCDQVQGYFFSKPLPLADFVAYAQTMNIARKHKG